MQRSLSNRRAGTWRAIITLSATLLVPGCRDGDGLSEPPTRVPLSISGDIRSSYVGVQLYRGGAAVTNAVVSVNGVKLQHPRGSDPGYYHAHLRSELPAGSAVDLKVSAGGVTLEATGVVPDRPVLTSPATGGVFALTDTITVTWTSGTDPDRFRVNVAFPWIDFMAFFTPGTARELTVTGSSLWASGTDSAPGIWVSALWDDFLSFTGPVTPGSGVRFTAVSDDAWISIGQ